MIPKIIPPLTGLRVLVTRPLPQAQELAAGIAKFGGEGVVYPAIAIEPLSASQTEPYDLVIFVSVHAVQHGARLIQKSATTRIAAIGKATAAALASANLPADIVPDAAFTSEALLAHPSFKVSPGERALIVRGEGGRELLRETLTTHGLSVSTLEVYRRIKPPIADDVTSALEQDWADAGIDVVTATSVATYMNLHALLTDRGRELLRVTPLLAPSRRIIDAAIDTGWSSEALIAGSAEDAAMIGILARWHSRARDA